MSSSIVTSSAYFDEFIKSIGLAEQSVVNLKEQGFTTLSALAYAIPPGAGDSGAVIFNELCGQVLGEDANNGQKAVLRRALHE
eukprot:1448186-Amphidinium_carterae.1